MRATIGTLTHGTVLICIEAEPQRKGTITPTAMCACCRQSPLLRPRCRNPGQDLAHAELRPHLQMREIFYDSERDCQTGGP